MYIQNIYLIRLLITFMFLMPVLNNINKNIYNFIFFTIYY